MGNILGNPYGGVLGVVLLVLDIIAIVEVLRSGRDLLSKIIWVLVILALPFLGLILYYVLGRN